VTQHAALIVCTVRAVEDSKQKQRNNAALAALLHQPAAQQSWSQHLFDCRDVSLLSRLGTDKLRAAADMWS
jgi:hypothetical protein